MNAAFSQKNKNKNKNKNKKKQQNLRYLYNVVHVRINLLTEIIGYF